MLFGDSTDTRWSLPDLESALEWVDERASQGIGCILSPHGEYSTAIGGAQKALDDLVCCSRRIFEREMNCRMAVKLTTLGALFDRQLCMDYLLVLLEDALENLVEVEIDMESPSFVDFTIRASTECLADFPLTVTLQAYLDRTRSDIDTLLGKEGGIRLVKGAYSGDISGFDQIQDRFRELAEVLLLSKERFIVGTHDPELIEWLRDATENDPEKVEFQFLKGLAEETKQVLVEEGRKVFEYVPYGPGGEAYEARRESYLSALSKSGLEPSP